MILCFLCVQRYNNNLKNGALCPVFGFLGCVNCCKLFVACYKITNCVIFYRSVILFISLFDYLCNYEK